jgi:hypothetical protein
VPGKIQEFLLVTVDACAQSEKIQGLACVSAFNRKKTEHLYHIQNSF